MKPTPQILDMKLLRKEGRQYVSRFAEDKSFIGQVLVGLAGGIIVGGAILLFWLCWINNA